MPVSIFKNFRTFFVSLLYILEEIIGLISTDILNLSLIFFHFQMQMPQMPGFSSKSEEVCMFSLWGKVFQSPVLRVHLKRRILENFLIYKISYERDRGSEIERLKLSNQGKLIISPASSYLCISIFLFKVNVSLCYISFQASKCSSLYHLAVRR